MNDDAAMASAMRNQLSRAVLVARPNQGNWTFKGASVCNVATAPTGHLVFASGDEALSVFSLPGSLDPKLKIRNGQGKYLLRQVLNRYVPEKLIDRPKMGFGVPVGDWLRGPLRGWAEDLLRPSRLGQDGMLLPNPISEKWQEHLSGRRNWHGHLWPVLMFQAWRAAQ